MSPILAIIVILVFIHKNLQIINEDQNSSIQKIEIEEKLKANHKRLIRKKCKLSFKRKCKKYRNKQHNQLNSAWKDVFSSPVSPSNTLSKQEYDSRQTLPTNSHYITNCIFNSITDGLNGGALYCVDSETTKLLIERSSFISCHSYSNGGAIFFNNGQCCISKVCGYDCSTYDANCFQFDNVICTDYSTYINTVEDSSISYSINYDDQASYTMDHVQGKININAMNISHNKCSSISGIYCSPFRDTNSNYQLCLISLSSFVNNTAHTNSMCMSFDVEITTKEIRTCNIVRNTQKCSENGIIYTYGNLNIIDSCLLGNDEKHCILYAQSYTITIKNCTFEGSVNTGGIVKITKRVTKSFINALVHINTQKCVAQFDSVGDLTAPQLSTPNLPSSRNNCNNSCFLKKPRIDMLGYLTYVFIITCLPTNPSNSIW